MQETALTSVLSSYRSPKTVVLPSPIGGRGLFAKERLSTGEIVSMKAGHFLSGHELEQHKELIRGAELQIAENLFLAPLDEEEFESGMMFLNHSCEPNVGIEGQIVFVAMRDIESGEELTFDYATVNDNDMTMDCLCGSQNCRKLITGQDWHQQALQEKYGEFFAWHLKKKMR